MIINYKEENRDITKMNLDKNFESITLNLHYNRFNNDYDNWEVWSWLDGVKDGEVYTLSDEGDYGKVSSILYKDIANASGYRIGFKIKKGDWLEEDVDYDRHINLNYANHDGNIDIYLAQGNPQIKFTKPEITKATVVSKSEIKFTTDFPMKSIDMAERIRVRKNGELEDILLYINSDRVSGTITLKESVDMTSEYLVEIDGFESKIATLGNVLASNDFKDLYHFDGDLGAKYSYEKTNFVIWAPIASNVKLALYKEGNDIEFYKILEMNKGNKGTWNLEVLGDLNGVYYTYLVTNNGVQNEVTDPYAKAVGVNGNRAMVLDMSKTNPKGWNTYVRPKMIEPTESIIYELHIRDFTMSNSSGASLEVKGKYNGIWESGTTLFGNGDIKTGIDHLVELGITHLHLLPTFDHKSIDETSLDIAQYNWGYDPQNYNVPEGSYSSNPYLGEVRVAEFKRMIMELHKAGIYVVMDVVYNHTGNTEDSHLNYAVPDYYYRQNEHGGFSNGSGCGNELASERSMVRKMIVDSVIYWAEEYHIDGFRFDLMALHDVETMKTVRRELDKINKGILVYGEGWQAGGSPLHHSKQANKDNIWQFGEVQVASFSDNMRDAIKGNAFHSSVPGYINGGDGLVESIKFGVVASTENYQVNGKWAWANEPYQTVTYAAAHDNYTLWDKLISTHPYGTKDELIAMNKMAGALVLTSQGIPFLHAGDELARSKINDDGSLSHNSYNSSDSVNAINWNNKKEYSDLYKYYRGLINLRKSHKSFAMNTTSDIQRGINFFYTPINVIAYTLNGRVSGDSWENIAVIFNPNKYEVEVTLPAYNWTVVVNKDNAGVKSLEAIEGNKVKVPSQATYVLVDTISYSKENSI